MTYVRTVVRGGAWISRAARSRRQGFAGARTPPVEGQWRGWGGVRLERTKFFFVNFRQKKARRGAGPGGGRIKGLTAALFFLLGGLPLCVNVGVQAH